DWLPDSALQRISRFCHVKGCDLLRSLFPPLDLETQPSEQPSMTGACTAIQ
ncbi:Hypothetical protein FKW44_014297, partial [Caligus rogercresseyi]